PLLLIPIDDYDAPRAREQYKYVYPDAERMLLRSAVLPSPKTIALFAMSKDLNVVLSDHFEEPVIEPLQARLWDYFLRRDESINNKKMYVYFHEGQVDISSFARRRFAFANTFNADTTDDAVYFILGAWKQINADAQNDLLFVAGRPAEKKALIDRLGQYVRRVRYIEAAKEFAGAPVTKAENMPFDMMMYFV
ncbi:MAG: DUF3822 family protein, partial [Prevotella sp.]|nr:DUF3822 family protein [Prevotella sp.]